MTAEQAKLEAARQYLQQRGCARYPVALVLGTGLGALADAMEQRVDVPFAEVPHLVPATATGHAGRFVFGRLAGRPVALQQGRVHLYEGHSLATVTRPVRLLAALGAELLITTNASGGLNPQFRAGQLMVIRDHINLQWCGPGLSRPGRRFLSPYDAALADSALGCARRANVVAAPGTYAAVTGPNYETRAECRMLRRMGADAVGMSTVPEILIAADQGVRTLALSVVSNVIRPDAPLIVDGEEVVQAVGLATRQVAAVIDGVITSAAL